MTSAAEKLNARQTRFLGALMSEATITKAAEKAEVADKTARRWLHDPVFRAAYAEARAMALDEAIAKTQIASMQAVAALVSILRDGSAPASARVAASRAILETAAAAVEREQILVRLAELELAVAAMPGASTNGRRVWT